MRPGEPETLELQLASQESAIKLIDHLDLLLSPCGGGGLLSGSAIAARELAPTCRVVGVEPELADDATRSFKTAAPFSSIIFCSSESLFILHLFCENTTVTF